MLDWQAKYGEFMDNNGGEEEEEDPDTRGEGSQEGDDDDSGGGGGDADQQTRDNDFKLMTETGTEAWGGAAQAEQSGKRGSRSSRVVSPL
jgi:hypothetical protein